MDDPTTPADSARRPSIARTASFVVAELLGLALAVPPAALAFLFLTENPHGECGGPDCVIGLGLAYLTFCAGAAMAVVSAIVLAVACAIRPSPGTVAALVVPALGLVGNLVLMGMWH